MKRVFFISIIALCTFLGKVHASSIDYNLTIDNDMRFNETIVYTIDKDEKRSFLKTVLNDTIYFDLNNDVPYTKTKNTSGEKTVVTLKHSSSYVFIATGRIMKECFGDIDFTNSPSGISFQTDAPFYCYNRADDITVTIKTDLVVKYSNAVKTEGNTYIWTNLNRDSYLHINVQSARIEEDPLDQTSDVANHNNAHNHTNVTKRNRKITYIVFACSCGGVLLIILLGYLVYKKRSKTLNSI